MFLASDALPFRAVLADVKDGWTFADTDGAWWVAGSCVFKADDEFVEPEAVYPLAGRVSFPRNLRGRTVTVEGQHYPTVCLATAASWTVRVSVPIGDTTGLNDSVRSYGETPGRTATASLEGVRVEGWLADSLPSPRVLASLPFQRGLMVGVGAASYGLADTSTVNLDFLEGEVTYVC